MRNIIPFLCLCLLCGCSFSRTVETDEAGIRTRYRDLTKTTLRAEVSAEFSDRVSTYLLDYVYRKDGESCITVVEPESIAGITVKLSGETPILSVGETSLETGALDENGLTPISALPRLIRLWESSAAQVEAVKENGKEYLLAVYEENDCVYRTLFSRESYLPVRGEIFSADKCVLRVRFVT
ncbi:MAG: hypothetical protein IJC88_01930 [Oscillospiraceae bacterium]|nr:hypothetical protein [Oscillospiraceae bacterium]